MQPAPLKTGPAVSTDVLVIGGGLAGHRAAIAARATGAEVAMVYPSRGASPFIIGCNAPLGD
jgi:succinate dehydrogenase/fumarate reductase flavoprotein subunit